MTKFHLSLWRGMTICPNSLDPDQLCQMVGWKVKPLLNNMLPCPCNYNIITYIYICIIYIWPDSSYFIYHIFSNIYYILKNISLNRPDQSFFSRVSFILKKIILKSRCRNSSRRFSDDGAWEKDGQGEKCVEMEGRGEGEGVWRWWGGGGGGRVGKKNCLIDWRTSWVWKVPDSRPDDSRRHLSSRCVQSCQVLETEKCQTLFLKRKLLDFTI